jgi:hypothetical protein
MTARRIACIGLRAKTARAIAVVLTGSADSPEFVLREELTLSDAAIPATFQPHHEVMELPWTEALVAVQPAIKAIQRVANATLATLIRNIEAQGLRVAAVAVVGSQDRPIDRIGNPHIRAHAAEGIVFRQVLEAAATASRRRSMTFAADIDAVVSAELGKRGPAIKKQLGALGKAAGPPWRSDEKAAAIAAWVGLARST